MLKPKQNKSEAIDIAYSLKAYAGEDAVPVIKELIKKKDYSEFKLAEAIKKEVNETRNLLYRLNSLNLASFTKKKDHKVGWYIHYWTFHEDRVGSFLLNEKRARIEVLKELILKENKGDSFLCGNCCVDVDFDKAFDFSFRCPECGGLLTRESGAGGDSVLKAELAKLEKDLMLLERSGEEKKAGKKKQSDIKVLCF